MLLIEDDPRLARMVQDYLSDAGFRVAHAASGHAGLTMSEREAFDVLVLDLMLPDMDGLDVCRQVRARGQTPILMLTARGDAMDRVVGLEMGADDYLTKPFSMRELMARVKAQLRRTRMLHEELAKGAPEKQHEKLTFGNLVINLTRQEVILDNEPLPFKPQEYQLLLFFAEHKGKMLSREFILERVWGWDFIGDSRTVDVHVRWLRQKIEEDASDPTRIVTVRGGGYRFEG